MTAKSASDPAALTRRERQIMDILYRRGRATAGEVMDELPATPHYSTVRTQLRVLEEKGHVTPRGAGAALRLRAGRAHAARRGSRRCGISSTRSSTARPSRSSRRCSAARAQSSRTKSSTALPSSSRKPRRKEADEDVLDCLRRAGGDVSCCAGARPRCGTGCWRRAIACAAAVPLLATIVPAWTAAVRDPGAFVAMTNAGAPGPLGTAAAGVRLATATHGRAGAAFNRDAVATALGSASCCADLDARRGHQPGDSPHRACCG